MSMSFSGVRDHTLMEVLTHFEEIQQETPHLIG